MAARNSNARLLTSPTELANSVSLVPARIVRQGGECRGLRCDSMLLSRRSSRQDFTEFSTALDFPPRRSVIRSPKLPLLPELYLCQADTFGEPSKISKTQATRQIPVRNVRVQWPGGPFKPVFGLSGEQNNSAKSRGPPAISAPEPHTAHPFPPPCGRSHGSGTARCRGFPEPCPR